MKASLRIGLALLVLGSAVAAAAETASALPVDRWLVRGPVLDPLPAFHDADRGGFDVKARLELSVFPEGGPDPVAGPLWAEMAAEDGKVALIVPEGTGEQAPAAAWLATRVRVDRFRKLKIEALGPGPRRLWLDGRQLASGGTGEGDEGGTVSAEVELIRGKHLLVVETLATASGRGWRAGAVLRPLDELGADGIATTLDAERDLTILDVLDPPSVASVSLSPDGVFAAAGLERYYPGTDDRESWVEVYALGPYRTIRGGVDVGQVDWAPSGHRLSYVSSEKQDDGKSLSTLWVLDLDSNRIEPVLERVPHFAGYAWSPKGDMLVYLTEVEPDKDERGFKRLEGLMDRWAGHRTKQYLNLLTLSDGMRRRLTAGPVSTVSPAFSPDGRRLLFTRSIEDVAERPYSRTELWQMDLATFAASKLRDFVWLSAASYGPEGRRILVRGGPDTFGEVGVNVPEGMIPNSFDGQLFVWDPSTDEAQAITRDFDPAVQDAVWNWGTGKIVLTAEDRDYVRLYAYDPATASFEVLNTGYDTFKKLASSLGSPAVAGVGSSPWEPAGLVAVDITRNVKNTMARPAAASFKRVRRGRVEPWSFESSEGVTIDGRFYLPPDFEPDRKYPLIVFYYGGTLPTSRNFAGRYPLEYWSAQGYVVYDLQPSGATGFGQARSAVHVNDWGKTSAREVIEGTRAFLEAHPFVDPARVGCIGASYGGFLTMLLTTETDLFAAAVAHAGISSISSYWGEGYWGWGYGAVASAGSFPWNRPELYVDQSPLFRADRNRVPILLTHGTADTNVPVGESDQFFVALRLLGRPVEYLQVEGQNHWIVDHDKRVVWSRSIVAWFDRWLKDQPQWWQALWGK